MPKRRGGSKLTCGSSFGERQATLVQLGAKPMEDAKLPRHVLQFLHQEIRKYPDLWRKMLAAAVGDIDTGFRNAGPFRQKMNEIALLDAVVAKIAGDQPDATPTQRRFVDRLGIVRLEFAGDLDLLDPVVELETPSAAGRGIVAVAQTMVGFEIGGLIGNPVPLEVGWRGND